PESSAQEDRRDPSSLGNAVDLDHLSPSALPAERSRSAFGRGAAKRFSPDRSAHQLARGTVKETALIRSSDDEKNSQIENVKALHDRFPERDAALAKLKETAKNGGNVFGELMEAVKTCSLGSISNALFEVGGAYRRSM